MAVLSKICGCRKLKQGARLSQKLNRVDASTIDSFLNGEYFLAPVGGPTALSAVSIISGSRTQSVAIGQIQILGATGIRSGATVGTPMLQLAQTTVDLFANNITSGSRVGQSLFAQVNVLGATGIRADSRTATSDMTVIFHLDPNDIASGSRTGLPQVNQIHVIGAIGNHAGALVGIPSISIGANAFGKICVDGVWRNVIECQIVINDEWKTVTEILTAQGESWNALGA